MPRGSNTRHFCHGSHHPRPRHAAAPREVDSVAVPRVVELPEDPASPGTSEFFRRFFVFFAPGKCMDWIIRPSDYPLVMTDIAMENHDV